LLHIRPSKRFRHGDMVTDLHPFPLPCQCKRPDLGPFGILSLYEE
jgi:hypothetical protein